MNRKKYINMQIYVNLLSFYKEYTYVLTTILLFIKKNSKLCLKRYDKVYFRFLQNFACTALPSCGGDESGTCHLVGQDRSTCRLIAASMHLVMGR